MFENPFENFYCLKMQISITCTFSEDIYYYYYYFVGYDVINKNEKRF